MLLGLLSCSIFDEFYYLLNLRVVNYDTFVGFLNPDIFILETLQLYVLFVGFNLLLGIVIHLKARYLSLFVLSLPDLGSDWPLLISALTLHLILQTFNCGR